MSGGAAVLSIPADLPETDDVMPARKDSRSKALKNKSDMSRKRKIEDGPEDECTCPSPACKVHEQKEGPLSKYYNEKSKGVG